MEISNTKIYDTRQTTAQSQKLEINQVNADVIKKIKEISEGRLDVVNQRIKEYSTILDIIA